MTLIVRSPAVAAILMVFPPSLLAQDSGQVSIQILSSGQSSMTVAPGPVDLQLDLKMSTTVGLVAAEFALDCSSPALFVYAEPTVSNGSPFTETDLNFVPIKPPANDGTPLSDHPRITFFRLEAGSYEPALFPSVVLTYHVRSIGTLPSGASYTFSLTEDDELPLWISDSGPTELLSGKIAVGTEGIFTLQVSAGDNGGTPSGESETTPGDGSDTPDDGGTTPGDGETTPDDGGTTPDDGSITPGDGDATPHDEGTTPGDAPNQPSEGSPATTPTGTTAFCGAGVGPASLSAVLLGLWLISPRPRRR
ncbi:MAG: hypothetical protein KA354_11910 [Phycisphaerae bacterium]|nr:hypothetical protein [Phycisphaerae bacterium]